MSLALGILGAVGSLAGTVAGAVSSAKKNQQAQALINEQIEKNKAWYQARMAEDYTQRADAQAVVKKQRELLDEQYKKAKGANVVAGGTDESLALQQQAANDSLSNTMTNLAAQGQAVKDAAQNTYMQTDNALTQQQVSTLQGEGQNIASAAGQAAGAGMQLAGAGFNQYFKSKS